MLVSDFAVELALCLAKQNDRAEALALVDDVIAGYRQVNMLIHLPALLLTKAMIFIYGDAPDLKLAEEYLQRSIAEARKQSTLSYELRAALQLARIWIGNGEVQRARDLMERLLRIASPLGLYAEEFDVETGCHLGNFPQAFTHLALIEAASRIVYSERLQEFT